MRHADAKRAAFEQATRPSELIAIGLADLEACEADPRYAICMAAWHMPALDAGPCFVCMAGSTMAQRLGVPIGEYDVDWLAFDGDCRAKLFAINFLSVGSVHSALENLKAYGLCLGAPDDHRFDRPIVPYNVSPQGFKADMRRLQADLAGAGL